MAQVPYSGPGASVAPNPTPPDDYQRIPTNPNMFGGAIAEGEQRLGAGASQAGKFFGQVQTDDVLNNAMSIAGKQVEAFKKLRGADALNAQDETNSNIDDAFKSARDQLATPEQKLQFDSQARFFRERYIAGQIGTHADDQAHAFATDTNTRTYDNGRRMVAANPDDPDALSSGLSLMHQGRIKLLQLNGLGNDPQALTSENAATNTEFLETRIKSLAATNPTRAKELFDANSKDLAASPNFDALSNYVDNKATEQVGVAAGRDAVDKAAKGTQSQPQQPGGQYVAPQAVPEPMSYNMGNVMGKDGVTPVRYATPVDGAAATVENLRKNYRGMTIAEIAQKWAPRDDGVNPALKGNNPAQWAQNVAKVGGFFKDDGTPDPNAKPNLDDPAMLARIATGIATAEKSLEDRKAFTPGVISSGVDIALHGEQISAIEPGVGKNAAPPPGVSAARSLKANAVDLVMTDPNLAQNPKAQQVALHYINEQYSAAQVAAMSDDKARKEAQANVADDWGKQIWKTPVAQLPDLLQNINGDDKLNGDEQTRQHLIAILNQRFREEGKEIIEYGPQYTETLKAVSGSSDQGSTITDPRQLIAMQAKGEITETGRQHLLAAMKEPSNASINTTKSSLYDYAKGQLSFESDTGPIKIRDPKGEAIFKAQFVPKFEKAFDDWTSGPQKKNPWEFLTQENVDKMIQGMRPRDQMALDKIKATSDAEGETQPQNLPADSPVPAPKDVDAGAWKEAFEHRPMDNSGRPWRNDQWARALQYLGTHRDEKTLGQFKDTFGQDGARMLKLLDTKPGAYVAAAPEDADQRFVTGN